MALVEDCIECRLRLEIATSLLFARVVTATGARSRAHHPPVTLSLVVPRIPAKMTRQGFVTWVDA